MYLQINTVKYMLAEKLRIFTRIYKQLDPSFSLICYYSFIFGLLQISIGLSLFRLVANEYQWRAIRLLLTIRNIRSAIRWVIPKVILNYSRMLICPYKNFSALPYILGELFSVLKSLYLSLFPEITKSHTK